MLDQLFGVSLKNIDYIFLSIGFFTSLFSVIQFLRKDNPIPSFYWPKSKAKILTCKVKEEYMYSNRNNLKNFKQILYKPVITFEYLFKNKKYISSSYTMFTFASSSKEKAEFVTRNYPLNKVVPVYVNPKNPKQAYIELSKTRAILFCIGMSLFMIGFPVVSVLLVIHRIR